MPRSFVPKLFVVVLVCAGALIVAAGSAAAQVPDPPRQRPHDSTAVLAPLEVHASISPAAGPVVGSGIPARVSAIDRNEIAAWRPRILTDVIGREAGVSAYDDLGSPRKISIGLRGFGVGPAVGSPAGISVFLDGVRQNEPDAQEVNFDLLPMDFVKRIEVLSGTASLLGPNGIGGAINLVTDRGSGAPHGEIEVGAGSFGQGSLDLSTAGQTARGWSYNIGAGGDRASGWRAVTSDRSTRGFFNIGRTGNERGLSIQGYASNARAQTAGSLPESIFNSAPRTNFTAGDVDDLDLSQLSASGYAPVSAGRGSFTLYLRRSHGDRFNANQAPDDNVRGLSLAVTEGGNADWRTAFGQGEHTVQFRAGLDGSADQVRVRLFDLPNGGRLRDSLSTDVSSPRVSLAAYALADLRLGRATFSLGARYDGIHTPFVDRLHADDDGSANDFRRLTPRGGVSVDLGSGRRVYASLGSSFRAPALLELGCADPDAACPLPFSLGDDPPLAPVSATSAEIGGQWLIGSVLLRGSVYRTNVHNEIFFVASENALLSGYFTNLDRTRREGAELDAEGSAGDRLRWYASYVRSRATFETARQLFSTRSDDDFADSPYAGTNDVPVGASLPSVPRELVKGGADLEITRRTTFGMDVRYTGPQWLRGDEANETRPLAGYSVVNARVGYERSGWAISAIVTNLLDTRAAVFGTFNENRQTGALERFLTPLEARAIRLSVRRSFGAAE